MACAFDGTWFSRYKIVFHVIDYVIGGQYIGHRAAGYL
jgi:hypothetical protein